MIVDVQVVQKFIDTMVGIPKFSYPADKNAPRQRTTPFCSVKLLEEYQESIPNYICIEETDTSLTQNIISLARLRFRIVMIKTDGIQAVQVMHGWTTSTMRQLMISTGYGFRMIYPISNEDALLEKEWEDRQSFALELYVTRTFQEVVDKITSMTISGVFLEPDIAYYDINIDVSDETN